MPSANWPKGLSRAVVELECNGVEVVLGQVRASSRRGRYRRSRPLVFSCSRAARGLRVAEVLDTGGGGEPVVLGHLQAMGLRRADIDAAEPSRQRLAWRTGFRRGLSSGNENAVASRGTRPAARCVSHWPAWRNASGVWQARRRPLRHCAEVGPSVGVMSHDTGGNCVPGLDTLTVRCLLSEWAQAGPLTQSNFRSADHFLVTANVSALACPRFGSAPARRFVSRVGGQLLKTCGSGQREDRDQPCGRHKIRIVEHRRGRGRRVAKLHLRDALRDGGNRSLEKTDFPST